jgi:hypothetical protein
MGFFLQVTTLEAHSRLTLSFPFLVNIHLPVDKVHHISACGFPHLWDLTEMCHLQGTFTQGAPCTIHPLT